MFESEFEEEMYLLRLKKLKEIEALGVEAGLKPLDATYPNSFTGTTEAPLTEIATIRGDHDQTDRHDGTSAEALEAARPMVSIAGRLMAYRGQGKAGFATLQQNGVRLQIYVRLDAVGERAFGIYRLLDLGDHIGVRGYLFRTRTGELTVHVTKLVFLSKAMLALPDKFHGLEDVELRYRQRYVDLFMNTGVREVFVKRNQVIKAIRKFFEARNYIEVETPMMQPIAGGAAARPFVTHHNTMDMDLYLRIAPELYLKRLVVGGMDRVYEINRNFRNEGVSTQHNPEFTMLEFYQAYSNYRDLMDLTKELVESVAMEVNGSTKIEFPIAKGPRAGEVVTIDLSQWQRLSMREAITKFWPEHLSRKPTHEDFADANSLKELLVETQAGLSSPVQEEPMPIEVTVAPVEGTQLTQKSGGSRFNDGYIDTMLRNLANGAAVGNEIAELFETLAEEHLIQPTIIYDFPLAVSPLSKVKPDEPDWVERFEFYIGGFEVGNAFSELNDPADQLRRFDDQMKQKDGGDDEAHQMDTDYVRALAYGLPPTAGEGIGIDRLTMLLTGSRSIRDVILFPLLRPAKKAALEKSLEPGA